MFTSLAGTQLSGAVLGVIFWTLATRALPLQQIGVGASLVAVMTLLSSIGVFGVGTLLLERFKSIPISDRRALWSTGLTVAAVGGAIVAATWFGLSALLPLTGVLAEISFTTILLLVAASGINAVCLAYDQAVIGMGASNLQLWRNIIASVLRIAIFLGALALGFRTGQAILVAWMAASFGSFIGVPRRRHLPPSIRATTKQRWALVRRHGAVAIGHHGLTLTTGLSIQVLPVLVASMMLATETAYFSQARILGDVALALPAYVSVALFATIGDVEAFRKKAPRTIVGSLTLALLIILVSSIVGRHILLLFGVQYSISAFPLLLLYLAIGPSRVVRDHLVVLRRVQGRRTQGTLTMALWTTAELGGALIGGLGGDVSHLLLGWLVASTACALLALPVLIHAFIGKRTYGRHRG